MLLPRGCKRIASCLIFILALVGGTAGCSFGSPGPESQTKQEKEINPAYGTLYPITAITFIYGPLPPADGAGIRMINERFNVQYEPTLVTHSDYLQKLTATIASGNLPDMIAMLDADSNYYKWAKQGAFLSLDDYIGQYPSLQAVPEQVWDALRVNGHIYGMPLYDPLNYSITPVIRKDWLDKLGLDVPSSYEELKQAALAFTRDDPDGNGKDDTYGIAMSQKISPSFAMGAYWDSVWYHKDEQGRYVNGYIGEGRKQLIGWLSEVYKAGAMTKDFAFYNWTQANMEFYAGKAGIFIGAPHGMSEVYMQGLLELQPEAEIVPIPPFAAPDGSRGFASGAGFSGVVALNAALAGEPDKLKRVLDLNEVGRKFYPIEERNERNDDYDWSRGRSGQGYTVMGDYTQYEPQSRGLSPVNYLLDRQMWAPDDKANGFSRSYRLSGMRALTGALEQMHDETSHYYNPFNAAFSHTQAAKGTELENKLIDTQTRMIVGDMPMEAWDAMVQDYMDNGGAKIGEEVNEALRKTNVTGMWKHE